jgi:hypothetical protein
MSKLFSIFHFLLKTAVQLCPAILRQKTAGSGKMPYFWRINRDKDVTVAVLRRRSLHHKNQQINIQRNHG